MITRVQLLAFGITDAGIRHRIACGRLRRLYPGVYVVGQLPLSQKGAWMAAVLACGDNATLSHDTAAALWGLAKPTEPIHVSTLSRSRFPRDIKGHRRTELNATKRDHIRVTTPAQTLIDIARTWDQPQLEQAIGEAVLKRLVTLKALRTAATKAGRSGAALRSVIDRVTQHRFGDTRVDFYWPDLEIVVETDGGRFHASAFQQLEDRRRDQRHVRAGRIVLRLTHWQVFHEPAETTALLADVFTTREWRRRSRSSKRAA